jgi:hypothetical protein
MLKQAVKPIRNAAIFWSSEKMNLQFGASAVQAFTEKGFTRKKL